MQFDRSKLRAVVLHTISVCDPSRLGAVKLHKVLYFSDMLYYAETGNPITGSVYKKRPFGPTCEQLNGFLTEALASNMIAVKSVDYFGYMKKEFTFLQDHTVECLSKDEMKLVDEVIDFVCNDNSAKSISDFSHGKPWESVEFGEEIRYNSVYHIFPTEVSQDAMAWASSQVEEIEVTRSNSDPVGYVDFAAFRSKVLEARSL